MLTVGGVLYQEGQRVHLNQCDFASLSYSRTNDDPYRIEVPLLTFKELQALDAQLPGSIPSLPGGITITGHGIRAELSILSKLRRGRSLTL